ncbi:MAG: hypothetical protein ACRYG8_22665 [Janthinobacterium lividum]
MTTLALLAHWRTAMLAALIVLVGTLAMTARHYHTEAAAAREQAAAANAEVATVRADAARNEAAIQAVAAAAAARVTVDQLIKETIHAAPTSSDCSRSPAVRALLLGLRNHAAADAPAGASHIAHMRP